jgi:hypothetical protein
MLPAVPLPPQLDEAVTVETSGRTGGGDGRRRRGTADLLGWLVAVLVVPLPPQ